MLEGISAMKKTETRKGRCWVWGNILNEMVRVGFLEKGEERWHSSAGSSHAVI